ncbi:MAG: peptide deformylase [Thermomicrobiales bacterium]
MAKLDLVIEPDPRYNRISDRLRVNAEPVDEITDELRQLAHDMYETMIEEKGVGLAAPQIGKGIRLVVLHIPAGYDEGIDEDIELKIFNPEIVKAGGRDTDLEGCLSFPDLVGPVERYTWAIVRGQNAEGEKLRFRARGIFARVLQHEIDHLNGVLFFDRMESVGMLFYPSELEDAEDEADAEEAPTA